MFTVAEQEFFRDQGFTHDPKRCRECRADKRRQSARRKGGGGGGGGAAGGGETRRVQVRRVRDVPRGPPPAPAEGEPAHVAPRERDGPGAMRGPAADRPLHAAVCTVCAAETLVPFVPDGVRPVYCLPCLKKQTR